VTFDHGSGKFPLMKARTCIYALIFAAGMVAALAQETNTTTQTGVPTDAFTGTNEVAVPPPIAPTPAPVPAVTHKVKPPVVVPLTQTSAVPAPSNVAAAPLTTTNVVTPSPITTSTSAPAITGEGSLVETSAVPAQTDVTVAESSGISQKGVLLISVAILAVAGGLSVFMLRSLRKADHASLITCAMSESKDEDKDTGRHEDKKSPPPMT
jgi:hypothetical protein